jgi:hypothetical protein
MMWDSQGGGSGIAGMAVIAVIGRQEGILWDVQYKFFRFLIDQEG